MLHLSPTIVLDQKVATLWFKFYPADFHYTEEINFTYLALIGMCHQFQNVIARLSMQKMEET